MSSRPEPREMLRQQTSSFFREFEKLGDSLKRISTELQEIAEEGRKMWRESTVATTTGGAACALGLFAAPFTGWLTLPLVVSGVIVIGKSEYDRKQAVEKNISQIENLRREFAMIVEELQDEQEKMMTTGFEMGVSVVLSMLEKVKKLKAAVVPKTVKELLLYIDNEADHLQTILNELDQMKEKLQREEERRIIEDEEKKKKKLRAAVIPKTDEELLLHITEEADHLQTTLNDQVKVELQREEESRRIEGEEAQQKEEENKSLRAAVIPKTDKELQHCITKTAAHRQTNFHEFDEMEEELQATKYTINHRDSSLLHGIAV